MQFKALHCWDCGTQIIDRLSNGSCTCRPNMREVVFNCSNGSYMESPFCASCAEKPWPISRVEEFKSAVAAVNPGVKFIRLTYGGTSQRNHSGMVRIVE